MSRFYGPKLLNLEGEPGFWCPGCQNLHLVNVHTPNKHTGAMWTWNGDKLRPTFTPSIHIQGRCHSFVTDGRIQFLNDCTHSLAGQTVDLPPIPWYEREFWEGGDS